MTQNETRFVSGRLSESQLIELLARLPEFFRTSTKVEIVNCHYGVGAQIHPDLWFVTMRVGVNWLADFIRDSIDRGIVTIGGTDFYFGTDDRRFSVLLCHEGDVHVAGTDLPILADFKAFSNIGFIPTEHDF
jgi:hypothetical protein